MLPAQLFAQDPLAATIGRAEGSIGIVATNLLARSGWASRSTPPAVVEVTPSANASVAVAALDRTRAFGADTLSHINL
jgi:hypothetical protein